MNSVKNTTQNTRKADMNYLERKLIELKEKYNLQEEVAAN